MYGKLEKVTITLKGLTDLHGNIQYLGLVKVSISYM